MPSAEIRELVETRLHADCHGNFRWQMLGRGVGGTLWRVRSEDRSWCLKTLADEPQRLLTEAEGLRALAACHAVRIPQVVQVVTEEKQGAEACLLMEWLDLGPQTERAAARLGEQLAHQHRCFAKQFGCWHHNFIGATPQFNTPGDDWIGFFRAHRLGFQLRLAAEHGYRGALQEQGARLMETLPVFFADYTPRPSLLHGDLWSGNWGVLITGEPVIFDPAVYYGDREADLAMTELFGGFPPEFYSAYNLAWPLDAGYRTRRDLYNLYHVLNHLNLFGGGYLPQAEGLLMRLLASVR